MFEDVYAAFRMEGRKDWVIETTYDPFLKCPWGRVPILESGKAEVYAWKRRPMPRPPKGM